MTIRHGFVTIGHMERNAPQSRNANGDRNLRWVKSSLSFSNGNCVELASLPAGTVAVRDTQDRGGPVLAFPAAAWAAFTAKVKRGT